MAEIRVERKPRRSVSPLLLILLLIVLIGAGWYWWTNMNSTAGTTTSGITPQVQSASNSVPTGHTLNYRRV